MDIELTLNTNLKQILFIDSFLNFSFLLLIAFIF